MGKVIYDIGYGVLKGTHKERKVAFQNRLQYVARGIGKPVTLIDIRREGSGSRNGVAFGQGIGMRQIVRFAGSPGRRFVYEPEPELANIWGGTKRGLERYATQIRRSLDGNEDLWAMREGFTRVRVAVIAQEQARAVVLLCGCKDVFKPNGHTWNCHRGPLGEVLLEQLGEGWRCVRL